MSVRITALPEATELNGSELMPIVQNGVTRRTTLDFVNQAAPAALILQQTQQVLADTQQVLADTQQVKADTDQVLVNTEGVYNQTVMVQGQVEISIADWETQYLGAKSDPPTTDNEGNPLHNGALYWDTSLNAMFVWSGTSWMAFSSAVASVNGQIGEVVLDYTTPAEAAAAAPVQSVAGRTGAVSLTKADVGLSNVTNDAQLKSASNLSDLNNAAAARTNLGLGTAATAAVLGTVSQSGGIPTGAIIERGSNANGDYVRFADGTQICTQTQWFDSIANTSGSIFSSEDGVWTFPAAFVSEPQYTGAQGRNFGGTWAASGENPVTATGCSFNFLRVSSYTGPFAGHLLAIGRWF